VSRVIEGKFEERARNLEKEKEVDAIKYKCEMEKLEEDRKREKVKRK
jgi:hypothetical protein